MIKVLYTEHDDANIYMLKMRLERLGDFEVLAAEDSVPDQTFNKSNYARAGGTTWAGLECPSTGSRNKRGKRRKQTRLKC